MAKKSVNHKNTTQKIGLFLGPVLCMLVCFLDLEPGNQNVTRLAAIAILMATWWITDAIPLAATAILPMVLFPIFGIMKAKIVAPIYFNSTIFLFIGGFMIALTMEKWNLHKRIALWIIKKIGGGPSRITLGFMAAAAFLSMWISNTATAIMMLPIGLAIISQMEEHFDKSDTKTFSIGLMIAIAYGCSIGGIATLVGTPPNLSLQRIFEITFPSAPTITFGQWIVMGLPLSIILLFFSWLLITQIFYRSPKTLTVNKKIVDTQYDELGPMSYEERMVFIVFLMTAVLWVFRRKLDLGLFTIPGWSSLFPFADLIDDSTVALSMAMILFLIPSHQNKGKSVTLMGTDVFTKLPWHIVILFGGGFALAKGFQVTGLSTLIGKQFVSLAGIHPIIMIASICFTITFLTELTSNTATTEMVLPILASVAVALKWNPLLLMIPATLSASCAFMMPVATPPNAIVFGSGRIRIAEMARLGIILNLVGVIVITGVFYLFSSLVFDISINSPPAWAFTK